jgi:hypothetical protein
LRRKRTGDRRPTRIKLVLAAQLLVVAATLAIGTQAAAAAAPVITLDVPADGATTSDSTPALSGSTNDASHLVTVTISGPVNRSLSATLNGTTWNASASPPLPDGTYTAVATQNGGTSATHTFSVNTAPRASFGYTPASPLTGDTITLFSTSTDPNGPASGLALEWDLKDVGKFADATGPTATVSFATAGTHRVLLRATNPRGASTVTEAIITLGLRPTSPFPVARPALMSPFPVVRIAGSFTSAGARIRALEISAPKRARIEVQCSGNGCPRKRQTKVASLAPVARSAALVRFGRFERSLRAGVVLEIRITQTGRIGKYTRFRVRRGRAPSRIDRCLMPGKRTPVTCPSQ